MPGIRDGIDVAAYQLGLLRTNEVRGGGTSSYFISKCSAKLQHLHCFSRYRCFCADKECARQRKTIRSKYRERKQREFALSEFEVGWVTVTGRTLLHTWFYRLALNGKDLAGKEGGRLPPT